MPKRRDWGGWAIIHADAPKNGAFCGGCIYCDHEDGACTITSASIWDIGKGGWRKCKHYTLYSIADTFKHKLEEFDFSGASEYLKEHSSYITEKDYAQIRGVLDEFRPNLNIKIARLIQVSIIQKPRLKVSIWAK